MCVGGGGGGVERDIHIGCVYNESLFLQAYNYDIQPGTPALALIYLFINVLYVCGEFLVLSCSDALLCPVIFVIT